MNQQIEKYLDDQAQAIDDDMNKALAICGGDVMKALRITLIANAFLEKKIEHLSAEVSAGYTRRKSAR
ncbi:MAG: hypothetical protein NTZ72_19625 [Afipia sp.]|nr:hypothetical protein [Afipia sp.]